VLELELEHCLGRWRAEIGEGTVTRGCGTVDATLVRLGRGMAVVWVVDAVASRRKTIHFGELGVCCCSASHDCNGVSAFWRFGVGR